MDQPMDPTSGWRFATLDVRLPEATPELSENTVEFRWYGKEESDFETIDEKSGSLLQESMRDGRASLVTQSQDEVGQVALVELISNGPTLPPEWTKEYGYVMYGNIVQAGWEILMEDVQCEFTPWQPAGACSALCGGGFEVATRRLLHGDRAKCLEKHAATKETLPPGAKENLLPEGAHSALFVAKPCNQFECKFGCEVTTVKTVKSDCTAECGGGVRQVLMKYSNGEGCPSMDDFEVIHLEQCNMHPCKTQCKHVATETGEDLWVPYEECSATCGLGSVPIFNPVLQRDPRDAGCLPKFHRVPCEVRPCVDLAVSISDVVDGVFREAAASQVDVTFRLPDQAKTLSIEAPEGFDFGTVGEDCDVLHCSFPSLVKCTVMPGENKVKFELTSVLEANHATMASAVKNHTTNTDMDGIDHWEVRLKVTAPTCEEWYPVQFGSTTETKCKDIVDKEWKLHYSDPQGKVYGTVHTARGPALYPAQARGAEVAGLESTLYESARYVSSEGLSRAANGKVEIAMSPNVEFCSRDNPCSTGYVCDAQLGRCVPPGREAIRGRKERTSTV